MDKLRTRDVVAIAAWLGLVSGVIEVLVLTARHQRAPIIQLTRDYVWMIPLAAVGFVVAIAVAGWCAGRLLQIIGPRVDASSLGIRLATGLAAWNVLLLVPRVHMGASLVLAAGITVPVAAALNTRLNAVRRAVRVTLPLLVLGIASVGVLRAQRRSASERAALAALPAPPAGAPNVVLITLDVVRAMNMSAFGYQRPTTPWLAALADSGVAFDWALSTAPWTLPSHASLFTGRWPHELSAGFESPLDGTHPTLASYLREHGYATAGFVANLKYCGYETGLDRGFTHYSDYPVSLGQIASTSTLLRKVADNFRLRRLIRNDEHLTRKDATELTAEALGWLDTVDRRPFFLFLNYFDAHEPYLPPAPYDTLFGPRRASGRFSPLHHWLWDPSRRHGTLSEAEVREEVDAYDGSLAWLDHNLSLLYDALRQRGLLDNTILVITSDHGEEFGEHKVFEHGYSLYLPSVRVPLIIYAPGRVPTGQRVGRPVSLRDIPSTIATLAGLPNPPFPGRSLARHWGGGADTVESVLTQVEQAIGQPSWFPASRGPMRAILSDSLHFIRNGDGAEELYLVTTDPWEKENLAAIPAWEDALRRLRASLQASVPPR